MKNKSVAIMAGVVIVAVPIFCLVLGNSTYPITKSAPTRSVESPNTQGHATQGKRVLPETKLEQETPKSKTFSVTPTMPQNEKLMRLKDELFITSDIKRKWEILCAFANEPALEQVFATEEERFRLSQITDEVINAIDTGAFDKGEQDEQVD